MEELQEFWESGLLEEYVLGLTSEEENRQVEHYIDTYPEVRAAYQSLQEGLEKLAKDAAVPPPPGLKAKILDQIDSSQTTNTTSHTKSTWVWPAIAAGMTILAITIAALWNMQSTAQREGYDALLKDYKSLETACATQDENYKALQTKWDKLNSPDTRAFLLAGNEKAPDLHMMAYWNETDKASFLKISTAPTLEEKECLQLWADVNGEMLSLGVLPKQAGDMITLPFLENAESLNVTIEPLGGSDHPNVSRLVANVFI